MQLRPQLGRGLPRPIKEALRPIYNRTRYMRYEWNLRRLGSSKDRLLIIGTIPKSGLHYMRFLLGNYLRLLGGVADGPGSPNELKAMFPNRWQEAYTSWPPEYRQPTPLLKLVGIDDFPMQHGPYQSPHWDSSRVLHLYRNPLDYAVSWYFYNFHYRTNRSQLVSGPDEVLDQNLDHYAGIYLSYREQALAGKTNLLRVSYEDLVSFPEERFAMILHWLNLETEPSLIERATEYSSRNTIKQFEERDGTFDDTEDFTGKFVRDGSIGQWKEYFNDSAVERVQDRLSLYGIDLDEFTLEAPVENS